MTENFFLNNLVTWRDRKAARPPPYLRPGLLLDRLLLRRMGQRHLRPRPPAVPHTLVLAGIAGIVLSSVWNYSISNLFTWQTPRPARVCAEQIKPLDSPVYTPDVPS